MGYWLSIGKAYVAYSEGGDTESFPPALRPSVRKASKDVEEPALVHDDEYDRGPSAYRSISYGAWSKTLNALPRFNTLMEDLSSHTDDEFREFIPVEYYEDDLDAVEAEAREYLKSASGEREEARAQRALWFVAWSRKARELYGDHAAFQTPGEWK